MISKGCLRARMIGAMQKAGKLAINDTITSEEWSDWIQYWCDRTNQPDEVRQAKLLSFDKARELGTWFGYPEIAR